MLLPREKQSEVWQLTAAFATEPIRCCSLKTPGKISKMKRRIKTLDFRTTDSSVFTDLLGRISQETASKGKVAPTTVG